MNNIKSVDANMNSIEQRISTTNESTSNIKIKPKPTKLFDYIKNRYIEKGSELKSTNTRIRDDALNIFGGNYHIPDDNYLEFLDTYFQEVFIKKKTEYFTEVQLENDGPLLVDIDLRFELNYPNRVYSIEHIEDLLDAYLEELTKIYQFDDETAFDIYVLEKTALKHVPDKSITKDGIHLIIGLQCDHITQQILRKRMIPRIEEIWGDFPIKNTWDDVLDAGISTGKTNWQMYGSTKPGFEPYALTHIYNINFDSSDQEISRKKIHLEKFNLKKDFFKLSARCNTHPCLFYKNDFIEVRNHSISTGEVVTDGPGSKKMKRLASSTNIATTCFFGDISARSVLQIKNKEQLDSAMNEFIDNITKSCTDYEVKQSYDYVMTLPESYYGLSSFTKWIRVGWALRNTSDKLFIVWIAFSAQSASFRFGDIPEFYEKWQGFDMNNPQGLTVRSIMHWSKIDAYERYVKVRENSIDYYIDQTLGVSANELTEDKKSMKGCGDYDLGKVLYEMYKDQYVCVSVKGNIWYTYKKHRWEEIDSATTLRKAISTEMRDIYRRKVEKMFVLQSQHETDSNTAKVLKLKSDKILDICLRLAKTNDKKNIMQEARDLFYDETFLEKLDTNPYLLCFNNGVFDFKEKCFRRGYPEDCVSKTTNIDYKHYDVVRDARIISEIHDFMNKLFPVKQLCKYMWDHLASVLIGVSKSQTFNMYIGEGSNGKSVLITLMTKILGRYKGDVPLSLVTNARTKVGGTCSELVELKGIRYAVMQEPEKGDKMNEGILKQLTSGIDDIKARAPYMPESITFTPQFKLVLCANVFLEVKSQDFGTWRRIRVVDFLAWFTDKIDETDKEHPYQYTKVVGIEEKFDEWKEVFMAMLVERAVATEGMVQDCDMVMKSSNSYRQSQDYISEFISDKIVSDPAGTISKNELTAEFSIWYQGAYGTKNGSNIKDVQAFMDKKFGKFEKYKCWKGARVNYDRDPIINISDEDTSDVDVDIEDL
jgi:P4 family phage/plasmid primase-like protien